MENSHMTFPPSPALTVGQVEAYYAKHGIAAPVCGDYALRLEYRRKRTEAMAAHPSNYSN